MRPEELVGRVLGHYRLIRQIGQGGMATVFLAQDIHLRREVAVKLFWPRPGETGDFFRRFAREARVLAQLDHPNILPIYNYGEQDGLAYLVMPYMPRGTLKDLLQARKVLPPKEALHLATQILNALQYAYERGLIHRDIKPGNMLLKADGTLLLSDFGLVKVLSANKDAQSLIDSANQGGPLVEGTPAYMAPEQAQGQATHLSDIYSVGIVLYEMLTGTRPFTANNALNILVMHRYTQPRSLCEINPDISSQLETVVLRALEKDPVKRYQQPADFLNALTQVASSEMSTNMRSKTAATPPAALPPPSTPYVIDNNDSEAMRETFINNASSAQKVSLVDTSLPLLTSPRSSNKHAQHSRPRTVFVAIALLTICSLLIGLVVLPQGRKILHIDTGQQVSSITPKALTASMPHTLISCPLSGARAAISTPMALGNHQSIVYILNEGSSDNPTFGILKRYDVTTGSKTEIVKMSNTSIDEAQVSADGQWILFLAHVAGRPEIRMVRMDGQGLQTLYCTSGEILSRAQWSPNQKFVIFAQGQQVAAQSIYLLNLLSGDVQQLFFTNGDSYLLHSWLDNIHVYMTLAISSDPSQIIYILDTKQFAVGSQQSNSSQTYDPQQIAKVPPSTCWDFASSYDTTTLFISQCTNAGGNIHGPSIISVQPATGGTQKTIYRNQTLAVTTVRVIGDTSTSLLLLIENNGSDTSIDTSKNGLWKMSTADSQLMRLTIENRGEQSTLNHFTQYPWSDISRNGSMYALEVDNNQGGSSLLFGLLSGGIPKTFDAVSNSTQLAVVGWTLM